MSLKRIARFYSLRFKRLQGSPHSLALGAAIGSAVGATPTLPFHNILILAFTLGSRSNPIAGILAANVVSNPLTFGPQYFLAWKIGNFLLPGRLSWEKIKDTLYLIKHQGLTESFSTLSNMGGDTVLVMLAGGIVLAIPSGLLTYYFVYRFFLRIRARRQKKHILDN
ncbi:DUF2062 domain-containing protein [Desulfobulbus rhabdoformis]|jgi:hypothetical protein|uniref:DUF2062 domain-containing protein n=1 Tax=Desulfobulbus rhabdoformis TaxID=34032 RepID=UPI0019634CAE|nr:DUF2062 domain-containing protein [Desulfobulbus rhabdoformis]MBM9616759.1 DUF2062 domain-containing protein [Desulfobulbus rhabdoformis]